MKKLPFFLLLLAFPACTNPNATDALVSLANGGLAYAGGNVVGAAVDALSAAAYGIQALQGTPNAADPVAIQSTATANGLSGVDAATVANAVTSLVSSGKTAAAANEAVAMQLYSIAKTAAPSSRLHLHYSEDGFFYATTK